MAKRILYFTLSSLTETNLNLFELWIGWENSEDVFEFRIEVNFYEKLSFSLPIRWLKEI